MDHYYIGRNGSKARYTPSTPLLKELISLKMKNTGSSVHLVYQARNDLVILLVPRRKRSHKSILKTTTQLNVKCISLLSTSLPFITLYRLWSYLDVHLQNIFKIPFSSLRCINNQNTKVVKSATNVTNLSYYSLKDLCCQLFSLINQTSMRSNIQFESNQIQ